MKTILLVGFGGFLGSIARFKIGQWALPASTGFPVGTFLINVSGCLLIGLVAGWGDRFAVFSPQTRAFLMAGLLGGFTTFSAFGLESFAMLRRGELAGAGLYVLGSVLAGVVAVWLGYKLTGFSPRLFD